VHALPLDLIEAQARAFLDDIGIAVVQRRSGPSLRTSAV
jgi:hypothetical protein